MADKFFYKSVSIFVDKDFDTKPLNGNPALLFPDTMTVPLSYQLYHTHIGNELLLDGVIFLEPVFNGWPFRLKIAGWEHSVEFFSCPANVYVPFNQKIIIHPHYYFFITNKCTCILFGRWRSLN